MQPKKIASFATLSNEALCKLRDEIAALLNSRAEQLQKELDRLRGNAVAQNGAVNGETHTLKPRRRKATQKYRGPDGSTWSGRGVKPRWLTNALKEGGTLEDFLIMPPIEHIEI